MNNQPAIRKESPAPMKPVRELAAMVKRLPKEERLRIEGVIAGMELARIASPPTNRDSA